MTEAGRRTSWAFLAPPCGAPPVGAYRTVQAALLAARRHLRPRLDGASYEIRLCDATSGIVRLGGPPLAVIEKHAGKCRTRWAEGLPRATIAAYRKGTEP